MACVGCGAAILLASVIPFIRIGIKGVASRDVVLVTEFHKSALLIVAAALALGFVGVIGLVRRGDPILVAIAFAASAVVALTAVPVAGHLTSGVICGRSCIGPIAAPAFEDLEAEVPPDRRRGGLRDGDASRARACSPRLRFRFIFGRPLPSCVPGPGAPGSGQLAAPWRRLSLLRSSYSVRSRTWHRKS